MSTVDIVSNGTATSKNSERLNKITFSSGSLSSTVKILDYTATGIYPTPIGGARMVYYSSTVATTGLYRFGGKYGGGYLNELWKYDLDASSGRYRTWVKINASDGPSGRYEHFMFVYSNRIYVGYGWLGSSFSNDLYVFDPLANTWNSVIQNGSIPTARQSDAYDVNSANFYMFGGLGDGFQRLSDCQKLDLTTMTWSQVSNGAFSARTNFAAATVGQYIYFYGGDAGSPDSTLFRLDTTDGSISTVSATGTSPGGLLGHRMVTIGTIIYIYGGSNGSVTTNTLWTLNVANPAAVAWGTSYLNILSYARCSEGMTTDGTLLYVDDGNTDTPGSGNVYSETWSMTTSGVATQLPTKQIYVNAASFTYKGVTFTAVNIGGTTRVRLDLSETVASGSALSLSSLRVLP
jgi:hypothetical protein